ncbi:hypothetical protein BJX61DRAFT_532730 [Aspergillus egyptiacus]|nr:hypothetical protein BJX61DRAFT_532730 [Aspergillus egyptiacus]
MEPPPPRHASQRRSPSRPSFQAPTKASLARSHPEILERSLSRSPTRKPTHRGSQNDKQKDAETRAFGLRDRKALRPSITLTTSPTDSLKRSQQSPALFPSRRSSGLGAFAAPPRRVSKRITPSDLFAFQSPTASQETAVEASMFGTPEDQLASELGRATGDPDLGRDIIEGPSLHDGDDEPDLPPTPTQLGLEPPPGRPRSLLSSSPSRQHQKRRAAGDLEQSPSKLRTVEYGAETEELQERGTSMNDVLLPESVLKKRKLRRELSADLEALKQDIAKLEVLCDKLDQDGENLEPYLSDISSMLYSANSSEVDSTHPRSSESTISSLISSLLPFSTKRPPKPRRVPSKLNPFALDQDSKIEPYLCALAPLKLTASSNIISTSKSKSFSERHRLILSAPRPFPPNLYRVDVTYETNLETQSVLSLSAHTGPNTPDYIQHWTKARLANPLSKLDVSGLCWGINRYWEALVSRALIWAHIQDQHAALIPNNGTTNTVQIKVDLDDAETLTVSDVRRIIPHFERASMHFESKEKPHKVILSCELNVDEWTGEPELTPCICVSGSQGSSNEKVEQESKKLFQAIMSEQTSHQSGNVGASDSQAIIKATKCVLDALFGANGGIQRSSGKL